MLKITFEDNIEPHVKTEIERFLHPFLWLIPSWCHELIINIYSADDKTQGSACIRTGIAYEYRRASMDFYAAWLMCDDYSKGLHIVHDLLHIPNSVYVDFAEDCINRLCPAAQAEKFNGHMMEESRIRCESMTQDLAKAIYDRFRGESAL